MQGSAGEGHAGHVAHELVVLARADEVLAAAGKYFPGLLQVQQGAAERIDIAVAGAEDAVIEEEPAFGGLDRDGAGADLHALPGTYLERSRCHHVAVVPPELEVRRFAVEDVPEGRVAGVGWTGQHREAAVDLLGEEHAVAVVRQEGVLHLMECLEIIGPGHADGGPMIAVAPGHVVAALDFHDAGVVAIHPLRDLGDVAGELDGLRLDVPLDAVLGKARVEGHPAVLVVTAEHTGETALERDHRTVEYAVAVREQVSRNHRVGTIAPEDVLASFGPFLPGHARKRISKNLHGLFLTE